MSESTPSIYWLNKDSRTFLERGYLLPGVTPEARIREIADYAEEILGFKGFADKFERYMHLGWFSLSSPIWSNFGAGRGLPISCNGSFIPDSMSGILEKTAEIGMMTKHGAGTSGYFGDLRARGSDIKNSGKSSGPVHFMELFDKLMNVVSQGSVRRGSFAAYLPVEHPDIMEFLQIRDEGNPIQNLSLGVTITDDWMNEMVGGDKSKRKVWARIVQKRFESGYPYLFFTDTVNRGMPKIYKDLGVKVYASNLCVTGDTLIEVVSEDSDPVMVRIQDLGFYMSIHSGVKVKSHNIESGETVFSEVLAFAQTGESSDLMEIEDEKGNILHCTSEHKVYTKNRGYIEAQFLEETDILENLS